MQIVILEQNLSEFINPEFWLFAKQMFLVVADKRVSMGWCLLRLLAKILALLRLSVNFFQLRLTKKLKINFFCFKELNINKPVFLVSSKQKKGLRIISG